MPSTTGSRPYTRTLRQDIMSAKERRMNKAKYPQVKYNELTMISYKIDEKIHPEKYNKAGETEKNPRLLPFSQKLLTFISSMTNTTTKNPYYAMEMSLGIINEKTNMEKHKHSMTAICNALGAQAQCVRWNEGTTIRDRIYEFIQTSQFLYQYVTSNRECWEGENYRFDKLLKKLQLYNDYLGLAEVVANRYITMYGIGKDFDLGTYQLSSPSKTSTDTSLNMYQLECKDEVKSNEIPKEVQKTIEKDLKGEINSSSKNQSAGQVKRFMNRLVDTARANLLFGRNTPENSSPPSEVPLVRPITPEENARLEEEYNPDGSWFGDEQEFDLRAYREQSYNERHGEE